MGKLGWFNWVGVLCWLELTCPAVCACFFKIRSGVSSKTLSHICGKLNLPILLFNVGVFTLINIDRIFLATPCSSLPIIWKLCWVVGWSVLLLWWCIGEGSLRCSLNLSPKVLEVSPMYSSLQVWLLHWNQYMAPFCWPWGLCPWGKPVGFWWCF